jgi:hypothetical protein
MRCPVPGKNIGGLRLNSVMARAACPVTKAEAGPIIADQRRRSRQWQTRIKSKAAIEVELEVKA